MGERWLLVELDDGRRQRIALDAGRTTIGSLDPHGRISPGESVDVDLSGYLPLGAQLAVIVQPRRVVVQAIGSVVVEREDGRSAGPGESFEVLPDQCVAVGQLVLRVTERRSRRRTSPILLAAAAVVLGGLFCLLVGHARSPTPAPGPTVSLVRALATSEPHDSRAVDMLRRAVLAEEQDHRERAHALYFEAWLAAGRDPDLRELALRGLGRCVGGGGS